MWKPDAVVPEHRWRARMVWVSLLVGITAYTIWLIWKIFDDRANPSTSLKITNDLFAYPYVLVCFYHGQGCGFTDTSVDTCVSTALTESTTVYFKDDSYGDLGAYALGNCVSFDLGSLEFGDDITTENDEVTIDMWWIQSDMASDETDYFDHIGMYMAEEEPTESTSSFLHVPYSRILPDVEVIYTVAELVRYCCYRCNVIPSVGNYDVPSGIYWPRNLRMLCIICCIFRDIRNLPIFPSILRIILASTTALSRGYPCGLEEMFIQVRNGCFATRRAVQHADHVLGLSLGCCWELQRISGRTARLGRR
ncbi:unnamed protein product [Ectocarpus sp. CCAP 1310/34]|nr:unnamed protein product [Ectocarpus sp. CCAP 1310/34]